MAHIKRTPKASPGVRFSDSRIRPDANDVLRFLSNKLDHMR